MNVTELVLAALLTTALSGQALGAAPSETEQRQAEALLADLERIVTSAESLGWVLDEQEYAELTPALLQSVCPTLPGARNLALQIKRTESEHADDPERLYVLDGGELSPRVKRALTAQRELHALQTVVQRAPAECPFWLPPDPEFDGRQIDRDRFTLNAEFGGTVLLRQTARTFTFGGGGLARVLGGYGFQGTATVLAGGELGGCALIRPGEEPTTLVVNFLPAVPVVFRLHDGNWHYDLESAAVALWEQNDAKLSYGARAGFAIGFEALNTGGVIPWAGLAVAYEYYFESGGRPPAHFLRGGFRAGVSWDP